MDVITRNIALERGPVLFAITFIQIYEDTGIWRRFKKHKRDETE